MTFEEGDRVEAYDVRRGGWYGAEVIDVLSVMYYVHFDCGRRDFIFRDKKGIRSTNMFQIHKSTDHGKTWEFDTEHSTRSKAEELIKQRMKAVSIGKKYKIVDR